MIQYSQDTGEQFFQTIQVLEKRKRIEMKKIIKATDSFNVVVDYAKSFDKMIEEGKFKFTGNVTSKSFPLKGKGKVAKGLVLLKCLGGVTTDDLLAHMKKNEMKPAKIEDMLAFVKANLNSDTPPFRVIAMGSNARSKKKIMVEYSFNWHQNCHEQSISIVGCASSNRIIDCSYRFLVRRK